MEQISPHWQTVPNVIVSHTVVTRVVRKTELFMKLSVQHSSTVSMITDFKWQKVKVCFIITNMKFTLMSWLIAVTSFFSGDRLQCYLPPMLEEKKALNLNFEKMFANHCDKLFSDDDTLEYKESQIRQLTYTYTCQATVLFACQVARAKGSEFIKGFLWNISDLKV